MLKFFSGLNFLLNTLHNEIKLTLLQPNGILLI